MHTAHSLHSLLSVSAQWHVGIIICLYNPSYNYNDCTPSANIICNYCYFSAPLRQSESQSRPQPQPQSGARRRCGGYWRGRDWDNYANGFNNFTPRPKCSAVQCRGGWGGYHVISLYLQRGGGGDGEDTRTLPTALAPVLGGW